MEQEKEFIETRCNKHKFRIITRKDGTQYFEIIRKGDTKPTLIANVDSVVEDYVYMSDHREEIEEWRCDNGMLYN